jgi:hypothetical protein
MATIKLLLGIFLFTATSSYGMLMCGMLRPSIIEQQLREHLISVAKREVGVRELTGKNDGKKVESYLAVMKLKKGQPWCAAFVSWVYAQAGLAKPRSGWSPDLFPVSRLARSALPGNILGIYFPELKRIAHVGIITGQKNDWVFSTEGNTNVTGSREGDGVYEKLRHVKTIYRMSDWVTERRENNE